MFFKNYLILCIKAVKIIFFILCYKCSPFCLILLLSTSLTVTVVYSIYYSKTKHNHIKDSTKKYLYIYICITKVKCLYKHSSGKGR